jgi:hypothetical protein
MNSHYLVVSGQWSVVSSHAEISTEYKFESLNSQPLTTNR